MGEIKTHHVIYRRHNYRNIELTRNEPGTTVAVLLRGGGLHYVSWAGLISRRDSKIRRGRPVKLKVSRVDGYDLQSGDYLIGSVIDGRAYAVIDTIPAVVRAQQEVGMDKR